MHVPEFCSGSGLQKPGIRNSANWKPRPRRAVFDSIFEFLPEQRRTTRASGVSPLNCKSSDHYTNQTKRHRSMNNLSRCVALFPLLLFFLLSILTITHTEAEVITLTTETFSDKVKEKDTAWFVKFCVPWCKHCKNLGTLWEDLGKAMEGEDEIEVGEVDCGASKPVCTKVDIHSYPTFKVFYDGEEVAKYQGPRDVESLKAFVLEEAEKAAAKAHLDDDKEL